MERVSYQVALRLVEAGEQGQRKLDILNRAPAWFEHFLQDPESVAQNGRRGATKKALLLLGLAVLGGVAVPVGYRAVKQFFGRNEIPASALEQVLPAVRNLEGMRSEVGTPEFDAEIRPIFDQLRGVADNVPETPVVETAPAAPEEPQAAPAQPQAHAMTPAEVQELAEVVFAENARNWQNDRMNQAIAWIALNRRNTDDPQFAGQDTLHQVLTAPNQFQGVNSPARTRLRGLINNNWVGPDPRSGEEMVLRIDQQAFERIQRAVNDVANGTAPDPTGGALYYGHASDQDQINHLNETFGEDAPQGNIPGAGNRNLYYY